MAPSGRAPRQVRMFNTPTQITISADESNNRSVLELVAGDRPGLLCDVGKVMWEERKPGKGSVVYADGRLYCRNEAGAGSVYLVDASPKGYVERGRFDPPDRTTESAWPHPVITNGKMYLRDQDTLLCYDLKAK